VDALRRILAGAMARGVISPGWYAMLTGLVMLILVWLLVPLWHSDSGVPIAVPLLTVFGVWSLVRGVLLEIRPRRRDRQVPGSGPRPEGP